MVTCWPVIIDIDDFKHINEESFFFFCIGKMPKQKMEEEEYKDAARIYSEMIVLGDSLFRVYTGERVEDMRKDYTIDELELQNSAQQKRLLQLSFIIILSLAVFLLGGFFYLKKVGKRLLHSKNELQKAKSMAEESIRNKSLSIQGSLDFMTHIGKEQALVTNGFFGHGLSFLKFIFRMKQPLPYLFQIEKTTQ